MKLSACLNVLALVAVLEAEEPVRPGPPTVRATGEAVLNVRPDQARLDIGVISQAQTAESAAAQNAKQTADVIAVLKKALGTGAEIQTSGYSVHPNYRHPRDGGTPTITGYTASNTVQVRTGDLAGVGKLIDAVTSSGANNVRGVQFTLKNELEARGEALKQAARNARANAEAIAAGFGMKVGRIVHVNDGEPVRVVPVRQEMMMRAQAADVATTPIEPGNVQVRATVTVIAELVP